MVTFALKMISVMDLVNAVVNTNANNQMIA